MSLSPRLAALPLLLLLQACGQPSPILVDRQPDASLLLPCDRPDPPPEKPTDTEVALGYLDAVQKYLSCEARHSALAGFVKGGPKK